MNEQVLGGGKVGTWSYWAPEQADLLTYLLTYSSYLLTCKVGTWSYWAPEQADLLTYLLTYSSYLPTCKVGTWSYWAPEQADGSQPYDQQCDMWSLGVMLYIMLSGRHPFEQPRATREEMLQSIIDANYSFDNAQWNGISGRARQLVEALLEPDPDKRLTASQLLQNKWVRGEGVPERPLPETVERLRAFKTASAAIHGSLLMAALLYQDNLREQLSALPRRHSSGAGSEGGSGGGSGGGGKLLRRSTTEGVGMLQPSEDFNVVRAAYELFDPDDKGHICADDLYRVCTQLGFTVSERDIENMLSVLAPSYETPG